MRSMIAAALTIAMLAVAGCNISTMLSQNPGGDTSYDFRRANWGDWKNKVKFSERGITPQDLGNVLIYKTTLKDIPVRIIYSFDDENRLRSAGYIHEVQYVVDETETI